MKGKQNSKTGNLGKHSLTNSKLKSKGKLEIGGDDSPNQKRASIIKDARQSVNSSNNLVKVEIISSDKNLEKTEGSIEEIASQSFKNKFNKENSSPQDEEPKLDFDIPVIKPSENTDNIKVITRFRPLNSVETDLQSRGMGGICVKYNKKEGCTISNSVGFAQSYTFDRVFDSNTNQKALFDEAARPVINDILFGYNGTIFTYGQSGSGKTHTMYGSSLYDDNLKGIIPRSIEYMFEYINDPRNEQIKFQIKFSMLEIYKEALYDLLNPEISSKELKIKETKDRQIYVSNLTEEYISNIEEFLLLIDQADQYRVVSETGLNKQSSRSHLLFIIEVLQQLPDGSEKCGKLNLIDLAGSEKVAKTGAVGETLEEAKKINLSLSTLGMVISSLSSEKDYIPYRDSKLTRILQDSLGGNYKTTLIVACSPHVFNSEETNATLKFAMRAKKIKNKVKQNIKKSTEELEKIIEELGEKLTKAKNEISRLKAKLKELPQSIKDEFKLQEIIESNIDFDNIKPSKEPGCERLQSDGAKKQSSSPNIYQVGEIISKGFSPENQNIKLQSHCSEDYLLSKSRLTTLHNINHHNEYKPEKIIEEKEDLNSTYSERSQNTPLKKLLTKDSQMTHIPNSKSNVIIPTFGHEESEDLEAATTPFIYSEDKTDAMLISSKTATKEFNREMQIITSTHSTHHKRQSTVDSGKYTEREAKFVNQRIERLEEQVQTQKRDFEKINSSNILLKESNIHLKERLKELTQNSDKSNKLDIVRVEEVLSKIEAITQDTLEKFYKNMNCDKSDSKMLTTLEEENELLRKKLLSQENDFFNIFKKLKLFENEHHIENLVTQSISSTPHYNTVFDKIEIKNEAASSISYSHGLTVNRSLFKDILMFFTSKFEFFNSDIYNSSNEMIKDLEKAKCNNIKSAFIK